MELKLNIYKNQKEIAKTYTCFEYDLFLGTCEEVLHLVGLGDKSSEEINKMTQADLLQLLIKSMDKVIYLLHDIFPELTPEDRKFIKVKELVPLFMNLINYSLGQVMNFSTQKN